MTAAGAGAPARRLALASDHHGVALRATLGGRLRSLGYEIEEIGPRDADTPVDYPPIVEQLGRMVAGGAVERGIVLGGTGSGESIAANKLRGVRAVLCSDHLTARISRENNDANVLVLGTMIVGPRLASELVEVWLAAEFSGGRHVRRLEQLATLERGGSVLEP